MEELEAVDWYDQPVDATGNDELRAILAHNRDEEMEHAAMVLEWLRRNKPVIDQQLREYLFKDGPIFYGWLEAAIDGICSHAGAGGPYAIALGPRCYKGLQETTHDGYPVMEHVRQLVGGPIVWAPAVDGAAVLSVRGGDFALSVGQDLSAGYTGMSGDQVHLYIEESFTFRNLTPEAAVPLVYGRRAD